MTTVMNQPSQSYQSPLPFLSEPHSDHNSVFFFFFFFQTEKFDSAVGLIRISHPRSKNLKKNPETYQKSHLRKMRKPDV